MFGFFKNKRDFDKAVEEEVNKREQERKKKAQEMWEEWEEENTVSLRFSEDNEIRLVYLDAENLYKNGEYLEALKKLKEVIERSVKIEKIIGLYVFILLVDVQKAINGSAGALDAYDIGISYYNKVNGEYVDRWREHLQIAKESYIQEEKVIKEMESRYEFPLTQDLIIALQRLEGLAVYRKFLQDKCGYWKSYDDVWFAVLKEVEDFEQGIEKCNLNKTTYKGAKNWLKNFAGLTEKDIPDEYRK